MKKNDFLEKIDEWILEQKLQEYAEHTLKQYKASVMKFIDWLPPDKEVTKETMIDYKKHLISIAGSTNSINTWIVIVNKYMKWLDQKELVLKKIKIQVKQSNEDVLSLADYKRLLRISKRLDYMNIYYIMKVLAMTGIRISELRYFTYENIQASNYIKVFNKGKERMIIVRQDLLRELKQYCKKNNITSGYVFAGKYEGKPLNESTIFRKLKKISGIAKVNKKKVHPHSFRHLFAQVYLTYNENNVSELADILGHNSLETTRIYTKTTDKQKRLKLEKLKFG